MAMDRSLLHVIRYGTYRRLQDTFNAIPFIPGAHVSNISPILLAKPGPLESRIHRNSKLNGKCTDDLFGRKKENKVTPSAPSNITQVDKSLVCGSAQVLAAAAVTRTSVGEAPVLLGENCLMAPGMTRHALKLLSRGPETYITSLLLRRPETGDNRPTTIARAAGDSHETVTLNSRKMSSAINATTIQEIMNASTASKPLQPSDMPYPIFTKSSQKEIDSILTTATVLGFSDKILITITQSGRLSQWFQVPLDAAHPAFLEAKSTADDDGLLPLTHLTPKCLLGATTPERQAQGQLYAVQLASLLAMRNIRETRTVLVGLGLDRAEHTSDTFLETLELVGSCLP
ncbi:hypothetical protein TWF569_006495 [Orbilia oligospora]|nr:hypothetical protein TWF569_006495 [Orbilia oligospora]